MSILLTKIPPKQNPKTYSELNLEPTLTLADLAIKPNPKSKKPTPQTETLTVICKLDDENLPNKKTNSRYTITCSDPKNIKKQIQTNNYTSLQNFQLSIEASQLKQTDKINHLLSIDAIRTKLIPYNFQLHTALQVINEMNSNAILADEVGLGKTIEAGLIMKELLLREEVNSVLIVTPKSLLSQWKNEMAEKFGESFTIANGAGKRANLASNNRLICSHNLLLKKHHPLINRTWDLIVIDEAHAFRNTHSKGRATIADMRKNHLLLLTATPLCNRLTDLYSIVDLIQPGLLGSERAFISRFAKDTRSRVVKQQEATYLKHTIQEVMCRTRREQTGIPFTKRCVESRTLKPNNPEREFIEEATTYLRKVSNNHYKTIETLIAENPTRKITTSQSNAILVFQAITLQQSFSSSPYAAIESLKRRQQRFPIETQDTTKLIELAQKVKGAKTELLRNVLNEIPREQAVLFCLRKITAHKIQELIDAEFGQAAVYVGDMNQTERDKVITNFKNGKTKYLIATDAAAEGLNLQNCCVMFNYDLHWNPMKIEQRIGRIHRYKQERDVTIFNLAVKDTIDDYVLHVLYQKIDLFTMAVGKMETILAELKEDAQDIQKTIGEILLRSNSRLDIPKELEKLAENLNMVQKNQELAKQFTQGVLD
ncbi:MAG: DEAD/DEAH box helicase [Nitrososphaerota archaeon]|jgi:SNF2 family DNA or RNA helicase|nr:DEAD/DEAH box helicase [Nitrososphaerota archaeon]